MICRLRILIHGGGVFMSLDTEEFGLDSKELADSSPPEEPEEETIFSILGDQAAGYGAVAVLTAVIGFGTYYTFFTKEAEEKFYYSAQRDRAMQQVSQDGFDFRDLDVTTTRDLVEKARARAADSPPPVI